MTSTRVYILVLLLLGPIAVQAQVPAGADTLAQWQGVDPVKTYVSGSDTLLVLGDSTWVALQDRITIGCRVGLNGDQNWVFRPREIVMKYVRAPDTTLTNDESWALQHCIWYVQMLWRYEAGLLP